MEYGEGGTPFVTAAACEIPEPGAPRIGGMRTVRLVEGTRARAIYGAQEVREIFACSFELSRERYMAVEGAGMRIAGYDDDDGARIVELTDHDFYVATLFLPQMLSRAKRPHPLFIAFIQAAVHARQRARKTTA